MKKKPAALRGRESHEAQQQRHDELERLKTWFDSLSPEERQSVERVVRKVTRNGESKVKGVKQ